MVYINNENENKRSVLPPFYFLMLHKPPRLYVVRLIHGGGNYGRISIIINYSTTILWISRSYYHKFCLVNYHLVFTT